MTVASSLVPTATGLLAARGLLVAVDERSPIEELFDRYHLTLLAVALVLGGLVVWLARRAPRRAAAHPIAVASVLAAGLSVSTSGLALAWIVAIPAVLLLHDTEGRHPMGAWATPMAVVSLVGVWTAVPDTEPPLAAFGLLAPLAVWSVRRLPGPGRTGTVVLVVTVLGAALCGSAGRTAAMASAVALGAVLCAPSVLGFRDEPPPVVRRLVAVHLPVALVVPRVLMERAAPVALLGAVAVLALCALACRWAGRVRPRSGSGRAGP